MFSFSHILDFILCTSVFSENVVRLKVSMDGALLTADLSLIARIQTMLYGEVWVVILYVLLVHNAGYLSVLLHVIIFDDLNY